MHECKTWMMHSKSLEVVLKSDFNPKSRVECQVEWKLEWAYWSFRKFVEVMLEVWGRMSWSAWELMKKSKVRFLMCSSC